MAAAGDETNGTLLITWARNPSPIRKTKMEVEDSRPDVGELIAPAGAVASGHACTGRGCDCVNEVKGVGIYRLAPDSEEGPQCILVADNDYYGVLGPA